MHSVRVIPRLDIKGPNVVKGIHMEGLRVIGTPAELARKYYEQGADELIAMDIVASLYQRNPDFDLMRSIADELFIPLTMGGGIQSLHDINNFLRAGADKVAINSHAIRNPNLLPEAVRQFGSQCIVLSIEAKRRPGGGWEAYTDGGREHSGLDAIEWIKRALAEGIGEILLTSVDFDGTKKGYDRELLAAVTAFADVPVVIHGGAKDAASLTEAIQKGHADAVSMASILHYNEWTIGKLKEELSAQFIPIRIF
ncbi:imidazole glycerol phosphate synthase subunit HisF [Candidatus Peregrinibacteria bacterium CG1_02_54_53]|nr:MAG: imidazole glycerol phosphate synthase subunit HisF [Candidatus Peregrinibacteria bacterium CG1_02_54_53]